MQREIIFCERCAYESYNTDLFVELVYAEETIYICDKCIEADDLEDEDLLEITYSDGLEIEDLEEHFRPDIRAWID